MFELQRRLQTTAKSDKSMSDFLREVKNVCDQLSAIGSPVTEKMKIFAALNGLGKEYEPIKTSIEGSTDTFPSPTFKDDVPRLTAFDDRLQSYEVGSSVSPHLAFTTVKSEDSSGYYNSNCGRGNTYGRSGGRFGNSGVKASSLQEEDVFINKTRLLPDLQMETPHQFVKYAVNHVIKLSDAGIDSAKAISMKECLQP